jgi:uncharacterized protein (UPF0276 family)
MSCAALAESPLACGIGWRTPHYRELLEQRPAVGFIEVHSENFFGRGGMPLGGQRAQLLQRARAAYPLSLHGVGLSLGSTEMPDEHHLAQLVQLVERFEPRWVSEHLSWSAAQGIFSNDLLPLPYTEESLAIVCCHVQRVQERIGRRILVENPSRYLDFRHSVIDECEFLAALSATTGCGLLLDINNVHVSASNLGFDATDYLRKFPAARVEEIHLAGYAPQDGILVDTHSRPVAAAVWTLYAQFLAEHGDRPTLTEWDADIPALSVLLDEAGRADAIREQCRPLPEGGQ